MVSYLPPMEHLVCSIGGLEVDEEPVGAIAREEAVETGQILVHSHERLVNCS